MESKTVRLALAAAASVLLSACGANDDEPKGGRGASGGSEPGAAGSSSAAGDFAGGGGSAEGGSGAAGGNDPGGQAGSPATSRCQLDAAAALALPDCEIPTAPLLPTIHAGAVLGFCTVSGAALQVGTSSEPDALAPDGWTEQNALALSASDAGSSLKVFARLQDPGCDGEPVFEHVYAIVDAYPGPAGDESSTAIAMDDPAIVGWASGWASPVAYGTDVDDEWRTPEEAVGAASGIATDVVALGNGGSITLTFDPAITDGPGFDFLVFENGYSDTFLELAFVEVSSDGIYFVRFDSAYLGTTPVAQYGNHDTELIEGLAGKYVQGYGGPFDLALLRYAPEVQAGRVDLSRITHVRVIDIVGDGATVDSFGNPIYDPHPTVGSGGFDLDAIGVLNAAE